MIHNLGSGLANQLSRRLSVGDVEIVSLASAKTTDPRVRGSNYGIALIQEVLEQILPNKPPGSDH
jgi:hypothetical protein